MVTMMIVAGAVFFVGFTYLLAFALCRVAADADRGIARGRESWGWYE